jgi:hypothetical protein
MTPQTKVKTETVQSDGLSPTERDFARRLHGAAIAKGKAEAELARLSPGLPVAFRVRGLARLAQAKIAWLRVYFEIVEHFKAERPGGNADAPTLPTTPPEQSPDRGTND